jgi:mannosyltransferase
MTAELYVTNFNPRFTGVSATAANVAMVQAKSFDLRMVGAPLPGCPKPLSKGDAIRASKTPPEGRAFSIWHVRRDPEMMTALWVRDILRRPIKIVFTSAAQRRHSMIPRKMISRMDAVIATTEAAASYVPNTTAVVPHGVNTDLFQPAADRNAVWAASGFGGTRGVATIGRIRPEKGTDIFVDTMLEVLPRTPDLTALVIGRAAPRDQRFLEDQKAKIAKAGLTDRLLFPGEMPPDDLARLMPGLTMVVNLPRYEGFGMVPLEAMAAGVPFVASDTGFYRSFSDGGRVGQIVNVEDIPAAARALSSYLDDPIRHATSATSARELAVARFSVDAEAAGIAKVYETLWST